MSDFIELAKACLEYAKSKDHYVFEKSGAKSPRWKCLNLRGMLLYQMWMAGRYRVQFSVTLGEDGRPISMAAMHVHMHFGLDPDENEFEKASEEFSFCHLGFENFGRGSDKCVINAVSNVQDDVGNLCHDAFDFVWIATESV